MVIISGIGVAWITRGLAKLGKDIFALLSSVMYVASRSCRAFELLSSHARSSVFPATILLLLLLSSKMSAFRFQVGTFLSADPTQNTPRPLCRVVPSLAPPSHVGGCHARCFFRSCWLITLCHLKRRNRVPRFPCIRGRLPLMMQIKLGLWQPPTDYRYDLKGWGQVAEQAHET